MAMRLLGGGGVAPPASYTYPEGTLFGEVERLDASGDYSLECGSGGESLPVEFVNNAGAVTISADTDWGNATADERLLAVRVRGDLTIDATKTLTAAARKLGLLIFVDGNLTVNGIIDMSARGANHSATGSDLTAFDVWLYEASAEVANVWPAAGGAGGSTSRAAAAVVGTAGTNGQTGGGGSGGASDNSTETTGAAGTGYSGGGGGGGVRGGGATSIATARGGAGGDGDITAGTNDGGGGGAGNPGGSPETRGTGTAQPGGDGTGGVLIVVALGAIAIGATGTIRANGVAGGDSTSRGGGGSGGGAISLYHVGAYSSAGTVQANGGAGGTALTVGAAGGAGSIREVTL